MPLPDPPNPPADPPPADPPPVDPPRVDPSRGAPPGAPPGGPPGDPAADDDAVPPELRPLAGRYTILGELGRGGMAVVYHARERTPDGTLAREVAIKVVGHRYTGDAEAVRRFEREARTVAGLDHPNIVRTLAIERLADDAVAIVTRYVPGETLRGALRAAGAAPAGGPFDFARAAAVLRDVAAALAHAHAQRIVHRDVKPENVFLEAGTGRALLADFGIARRLDVDTPLTVDGSALGTPTYMAPEQITGRPVDERTDVYALGLVGWEMLAGRRPWQGETLYAVLHRQQHDTLPDLALLRPDIPAYLLAAIRGALAKDPAGRWRNGTEFLVRLTPAPVALPALPAAPGGDDTLLADRTVRVTPETTRAVTPGQVRTGRRAGGAAVGARRWAAVAALLAVLGVGGGLLLRRQQDAARRAADAAVTGVTDAQLDSLLRAASEAAPPPGPVPGEVRARDAGPRVGAPVPTPAAQPPPAPPAAATPGTPGTPATGVPAQTNAGAPRASAPPAAPRSRTIRTAARPSASNPPSTSSSALPASLAAALAADARCRSPNNNDQRACLMAAVDRADAPLTRDYQALIAVLRRRAGGALEPPAVEALRVEQRAWVDARDRQCRAALAGREGGFWGAARAPCFATISDRRAAELRGRLARYAGAPAPPA